MLDVIKAYRIGEYSIGQIEHLRKSLKMLSIPKGNGNEIYSNKSERGNLEGLARGIIATIEPLGNDRYKVNIIFSLHQFYNVFVHSELSNYNLLTISNLLDAYDWLSDFLQIELDEFRVTLFEIGLNVPLGFEPVKLLGLVESVKKEKPILTDQRYSEGCQVITNHSEKKTVYYKAYDKSRHSAKFNPPKNLLRVEKVRKRCSERGGLLLSKLLTIQYLTGEFYDFLDDWEKATYKRALKLPKGLNSRRQGILKNMYELGVEKVVKGYKADYENDNINRRRYYRLKSLVERDLLPLLKKIQTVESQTEKQFKKALSDTARKIFTIS